MNSCPYCHASDGQIKAGKHASGSQRYQCRACGRKYAPAPTPQGYAAAVRHQAVRLYVDGLGLRQIARQLGVVHQSVANWVTAHSARLPDPPPPPQPLAVVEQDELFTFIGAKKRPPT
jgi:transposase-like protein